MSDKEFVKDKYTSILSLLELISGIKDDESFFLRQSIIKKVINSKIKIDTKFPEINIFNAFGFNLDNPEVSEKISDIYKLLIITKDFDSLIKTIRLNRLDDGWSFIKQYDENAFNEFKKSVYKHFHESEVKSLISQFNERWSSGNVSRLKHSIVEYFAGIILNNPPVPCDKTLSDVVSAYDNSIDIYLMTTSFYIDQKISYKDSVGGNDYLDLHHLTYLHGRLNQIVTDDKLLNRLMTRIFPANILRTDEV
jgi:hypothetical protein